MNWLFELYRTNPTAQAIAVIAVVCMLGMAAGSIKLRGIGLGTAAVLFVAALGVTSVLLWHVHRWPALQGVAVGLVVVALLVGVAWFTSAPRTAPHGAGAARA